MSVDVDAKPSQTVWVNGNVTQDVLPTFSRLADTIGPNVIKVRQVVFQLEDVMVSFDETLAALQMVKDWKRLAVHHHVTQDVDPVAILHHGIPVTDQSFVHIIVIGPWTQLGTIVTKELADVAVTEMRISDYPSSAHHFLHNNGAYQYESNLRFVLPQSKHVWSPVSLGSDTLSCRQCLSLHKRNIIIDSLYRPG